MLPNVAERKIDEANFARFFAKVVNKTSDTELLQLKLGSKLRLTSLTPRKKSILYVSLLQFDNAVKQRVSNLAGSLMNLTTHSIKINTKHIPVCP